MITPRMKEVLESPATHNITKRILMDAQELDCVDVAYDVKLAAELLMERCRIILGETK